MNLELTERKMLRINEIYLNNGRSIPNAFKMRESLGLNELAKYRFGEFANSYKQCNDGYF